MDMLSPDTDNRENTFPPREETWHAFTSELTRLEHYAAEVQTQTVTSSHVVDDYDSGKPVELLCKVERKKLTPPGATTISNGTIYFLLDIPGSSYPITLDATAPRDDRYLDLVDVIEPYVYSAILLSGDERADWLRSAWQEVVTMGPVDLDRTTDELLLTAQDKDVITQDTKDFFLRKALPNGDVISGNWQKRKDKNTGTWPARPQDCMIVVEQVSGTKVEFIANQHKPAIMRASKRDPVVMEGGDNITSASYGDDELQVIFSGTRAFIRLKEGELNDLRYLPELDEQGLRLLAGILRQANGQLTRSK